MADRISATYLEGSILPDLWITWRRANRKLVPFATEPYNFVLKLRHAANPDGDVIFTKVTGFSGFDSDPNLIVQWALLGEIGDLPPGQYIGDIIGNRVSDGRPRKMPLRIQVVEAP